MLICLKTNIGFFTYAHLLNFNVILQEIVVYFDGFPLRLSFRFRLAEQDVTHGVCYEGFDLTLCGGLFGLRYDCRGLSSEVSWGLVAGANTVGDDRIQVEAEVEGLHVLLGHIVVVTSKNDDGDRVVFRLGVGLRRLVLH